MAAIILKILEKSPNTIFTQTDLIDKIEKKTGKRKSKSAVSQTIKLLSGKNQITYVKGIGKKPAQISYLETEKTKPKPIEETKPKPIEETKPKPIEKTKPKPITQIEFDNELPTLPIREYHKRPDRLEELNEQLVIAKETVIFQKEEIEELKKQLQPRYPIIQKLLSPVEFDNLLMNQATPTGKNSYEIGMIKFRGSDRKSLYAIYIMARQAEMLRTD